MQMHLHRYKHAYNIDYSVHCEPKPTGDRPGYRADRVPARSPADLWQAIQHIVRKPRTAIV